MKHAENLPHLPEYNRNDKKPPSNCIRLRNICFRKTTDHLKKTSKE